MDIRLTAIVLGKREIGETDRLYTLYTKELGKVRAKAVGVRKPAAKLASALETLTLSDVTLVRNRGIGRISGAIVEDPFPKIRSDFGTLSVALSTVAEFDGIIGLEEPDAEIFLLLSEYLSSLGNAEGDCSASSLLTEAFFVKLLDILGYRIGADACSVSGERIRSGSGCLFDPSVGGIVTKEHAGRGSVPISENAVKLIRVFLSNRLGPVLRIRVGRADIDEVARIRKTFFRYVFDR